MIFDTTDEELAMDEFIENEIVTSSQSGFDVIAYPYASSGSRSAQAEIRSFLDSIGLGVECNV